MLSIIHRSKSVPGTIIDAELVLRSTFLRLQGSLAVRERKSCIAGLVAATAVVTEALKPADKRGTPCYI
jgi:hypothetical protein